MSRTRPSRKDAPTAASSPANLRGSTATLDELPQVPHPHHHTSSSKNNSSRHPNRLRPHEEDDDRESHRSLGPKSHSQETVEGDGAMHLLDSLNSNNTASAKARAAGQKSTSAQGAPAAAKSSRRSSGAPPPKGVSATRPTSRCESPLSPGRMTVPHSRRNDDRRRHPSTDSSTTSSSSPSSSSFFATTSSLDNTRHNTFVYQRNSTSSNGAGNSATLPSRRTSWLEREATAVPVPEDGSALSRTSSMEAAKHVQVPMTKNGVLSPLQRRSSPSNATASPLSKAGSPRLFIPTSPIRTVGGVGGDTQQQQDNLYEYVAMAKTVGPEDSIAAVEAHRRAMKMAARAGESPLSSLVLGSPRAPPGRRGSGVGSRTATTTDNNSVAFILSSSQATTAAPLSAAGTPAVSSEDGKGGATKPKGKKARAKKAAADAEAHLTPSKAPAVDRPVIVKRPTSAAAAAIMAAAPNTPPPMVPSAGAVDAMEAQVRPLGTPTGARGSTALFPAVGSATSTPTMATTAAAAAEATRHVTQEEAEGLWYMTMLEVKAQQQELEDLRQARRQAEDHRQRRQDDLRALNRLFLPHTHPQDLDCTLLYLKTVLMEPDDLPHGRLFLQQLDWLPVLAAVWTSPTNRIRSVEVAVELTWMDIPRLGVVAGLLYHHNAPAPLEELILRSDKLLGAPRLLTSGGDDATDGLAKTKRKKLKKKGKLADSMEMSNTSLNFVTELDRTGTGFGPGCPPFFIAPEEARDTLWLLLCAVATNTAAANFRMVLRGILTLESAGTVGGSSGGSLDHEKDRSASHAFTNFFSTRRREDRHDGPLLLKPASMLLDSFVVQPTLHKEDDGGYKRVGALFRAASITGASSPPLPQVRNGGGVVGTAAAPTLQNVSLSSTVDEAGFLATSAGSIHVDSCWPPGTAVNTPEQRSPDASRQPSSLIIVTSSPVGNLAASPDPQDVVDASGSFSPGRQTKRSLSTLMTLRTQHGAGRGTPPSARATTTTAVATVTVPTHQHHVRRRPWVVDSVEVEERPFYEVLTHRCRPIEEARAAAANGGDPSLLSSLFISHYHHPFNATHNDARFFISAERQAQLQRAVRRSAAVANGEDFPAEMDVHTAVYSSKGGLTGGGRLLHLHAPHEEDDQQQQQQNEQQQQGAGVLTPSSPPPAPPPPPVPCPPPLLFCETSVVFGLESAEEEARVLHYEEGQLRDRAADIWEALRKSVKHYNQAQQEARHKALKGTPKGAATTSQLAPMRLITLEY